MTDEHFVKFLVILPSPFFRKLDPLEPSFWCENNRETRNLWGQGQVFQVEFLKKLTRTFSHTWKISSYFISPALHKIRITSASKFLRKSTSFDSVCLALGSSWSFADLQQWVAVEFQNSQMWIHRRLELLRTWCDRHKIWHVASPRIEHR